MEKQHGTQPKREVVDKAEAVEAIREASWSIPPSHATAAKPDPLPGLPESRDLLHSLRAKGWDLVKRDDEAEIQLGALKEELELIKKTRRDPDEIRLAVTAVELAVSSGSTNSGSIIATARAILQFILEDIPEEKKP